MTKEELIYQIREKKSFLCVGLDTDAAKIPAHLKNEDDPVFAFNREIIEATMPFCVSYKINTAFYEAQGIKGWESMKKTVDHIPANFLKIADAKRGDIANTGKMYAKAFLHDLEFDAITVSPYMGEDSVTPFMEYENKWTILLALTSNTGSNDFQILESGGKKLYEHVLETSSRWGHTGNLMYVTGATRASELASIRQIVPGHFLLVPGVGAQGGKLKEVYKHGANNEVGLLVNVSRDIIYAGNSEDFQSKAGLKAREYQQQMAQLMADIH